MSLINQMLQDLQQRESAPANAQVIQLASAATARPADNGSGTTQRPWLLVLILPLITLACIQIYLQFSNSPEDRVQQPIAVVDSETPIDEKGVGQVAVTAAAPVKESVISKAPLPKISLRWRSGFSFQTTTPLPSINEASAPRLEKRRPVTRPTPDALPAGPKKAPRRQLKPTNANSFVTDVKPPPPITVKPLDSRQRIERYLAQGKQTQAIEELELVLQAQPGDKTLRHMLVNLLQQQGESSRLQKVIEAGLQRTPNDIGYRKILIRLYIQAGELVAAETGLQGLLAMLPDDTEALSLLGALYQQQQRHVEAIRVYQQLTRLQPTSGRAWTGLAIARDMTGNRMQAIHAYRQALRQQELPGELAKYANQRLGQLGVGERE